MKLFKRKKNNFVLEVPEFKTLHQSAYLPDATEWFRQTFSKEQIESMRQGVIDYLEKIKESVEKTNV